MYIPKHFLNTNRAEIVDFMRTFSFATIITSDNNVPVATHLPFLVEEQNDSLILLSHFAKANPHWKLIAENKSLVIFSEPHAYISPKHYESKQNVPTWNYISVHAYGTATLIENENDAFEILEKTINYYEKDYFSQWESISDDYKNKLVKGIVAFKFHVDELQGKQKLSQNKKQPERESIINTFERSEDMNEELIAKYMKKLDE